jgi:hypothetical protein
MVEEQERIGEGTTEENILDDCVPNEIRIQPAVGLVACP